MNGKEIKNHFGLKGKMISQKMKEIEEWQLRNLKKNKDDYLTKNDIEE